MAKNVALQMKIEGILEDIFVRSGADNVIVDSERSETLSTRLATIASDISALQQKENVTTDQVNQIVSDAIDALINGAPETYDTLKEIADYISTNEGVMDALNEAIGNKVDKEPGKGLSTNDYTTEDKTKLTDLANIKTIGTGLNLSPEGELVFTGTTDGLTQEAADLRYVRTVNTQGIDGSGNVSLDASHIPYGEKTVKEVLDDLNYVKVVINSFTNNVNTVEKGSKVSSVTLNWTLNEASIKELTLDAELLSITDKTKTITYEEGSEITQNKNFTLKATDNRDAVATKTTSISFLNGKYYGTTTDKSSGAISNATIQGLTKTLASSRTGDFTVNAEAGEYILFAIPATMGTPVFYVGGFEGGFELAKTFDYLNPSGFSESYNVYASTNAGLGNTTVTVK